MELVKGFLKGLGYGLLVAPVLYAIAFALNLIACFFTCGLHGCFESCGPDSFCYHDCGGWDARIQHGQNTCFPAAIWNWNTFGSGLVLSTAGGGIVGSIYGISQQIQNKSPRTKKEKPVREKKNRRPQSETQTRQFRKGRMKAQIAPLGSGSGIAFQPAYANGNVNRSDDSGAAPCEESHTTDVRLTSETIISVGVVVAIVFAIRNIFLNNPPDVLVTWIVWGILVLIAGVILAVVFTKLIGCQSWSNTAIRVLELFIILITGLIVANSFPAVYGQINSWFDMLRQPEIYNATLFAKARLMPAHNIGIYSTIFYVAVVMMILVGLVTEIIKGENGILSIFRAIRTPIFIILIALILAFISHEFFNLHIIWCVYLIIAVIGIHKTLVRIMEHFRFVGNGFKKGLLLYLSIRDISKPVYSNEIDKLTILLLGGLTLLTQIAVFVSLVLFIVFNFEYML